MRSRVEETIDAEFFEHAPDRLIDDRAYDGSGLDARLREERDIELMVPHIGNRKLKTQDGRPYAASAGAGRGGRPSGISPWSSAVRSTGCATAPSYARIRRRRVDVAIEDFGLSLPRFRRYLIRRRARTRGSGATSTAAAWVCAKRRGARSLVVCTLSLFRLCRAYGGDKTS